MCSPGDGLVGSTSPRRYEATPVALRTYVSWQFLGNVEAAASRHRSVIFHLASLADETVTEAERACPVLIGKSRPRLWGYDLTPWSTWTVPRQSLRFLP